MDNNTATANILFTPFDTPYASTPFSKIGEEDFKPAMERGIAIADKEIAAIAENPEPPTFLNTIVALEDAGKDLSRVLNVFYPLLSALSTDRLMDISLEMGPVLSNHANSIILNQKLWERVKAVYDSRDSLNLSPEASMLLTETYRSFSRHGALLSDADKEKLREITAEMTKLTSLFGQNVLKDINARSLTVTDASDLEGLPQRVIQQAADAAREKGLEGQWLFTLDFPVYSAFMKYSTNRHLRKKFFNLYTTRNTSGSLSNLDTLRRIVALRLEAARLLGYDTYADYSLVPTMAKNKENVFKLLDDLEREYRPAQLREFRELNEFAHANSLLPADDHIRPWDYSFIANKMKTQLVDVDDEKFRPYFPLESVVGGIFSLANRLYGINFTPTDEVDVYHPDVRAYKVTDTDGSYLGLLYTDFFPRDSKRPGAWMTDFAPEYIDADGTVHRPHVSIVMNFTKPVGDTPSLLSPGEVTTFLHEFGHALHGLLANTKYASLSGTNVRRDFVELPSQFNENFFFVPEFLRTFARHYQTGEPLPDEMLSNLIKSRNFGAAYACLRQLAFATVDMKWHTLTSVPADVKSFEDGALASLRMFDPADEPMVSPQFGHIFSGGYAAGYYSYKWSEVLDADAFAKFAETGYFNPETAASFRHNILEPGATVDPDELYRRFRGRDPQVDALLRRDGLKD